jgi:hypothetical protein
MMSICIEYGMSNVSIRSHWLAANSATSSHRSWKPSIAAMVLVTRRTGSGAADVGSYWLALWPESKS